MDSYILDLTIVSIILGFAIMGFISGFSGKILHWISWALAFILAFLLFPEGAAFLKSHGGTTFHAEWASQGTAFVAIFLFFLFLFSWISKTISTRIKKSKVGILDRNLGIILGAITGIFFLSAMVLGARFLMTPNQTSDFFSTSKFYPLLETCSDQMCAFAPEQLKPNPQERTQHEKTLTEARAQASLKLAQLISKEA